HEALIANGDEFLLENAFVAMNLQETFKRFLDAFFLPLDVAAKPGERDTRVIGHTAVRQDLAVEVVQQRPEIADGGCARAQPRKSLGRGAEYGLGVGRPVKQREQVEDLARIEASAFDAQFMDRRLD